MTNVPPEVATARALLRQSAPLSGSKARIYQRVVAVRPQRSRTGVRVATLAFCVGASTSAMAFGYHWVTHREPAALHLDVQTQPLPTAPPVPRRHKIANLALQEADAKETATELSDSIVPAAADSLDQPMIHAQSTSRTGSQRSMPTTGTSGMLSPAASAEVAESELSQQVRDYREAVAAMRSNPSLALKQLLTYRSKWHKSPIAQEVDLRVIEALAALGRHVEAANAARSFVRSYPDSTHLVQMRRIADGGLSGSTFGD